MNRVCSVPTLNHFLTFCIICSVYGFAEVVQST